MSKCSLDIEHSLLPIAILRVTWKLKNGPWTWFETL